jgi:hypothetical protein
MKKRLIFISMAILFAIAGNAQWAIDSTNLSGVNMYAGKTATSAVFSNGTEWNIFNSVTGLHTSGNLTISRNMIEVVSFGDKVYFGGGKYGSFADPQYTKTVNVYNNVTNAWTTLNMGTAREVGGAGAINNKIIFAGGTGRTDIAGPVYMYNKVDIFDATTGARTNGKLSKARTNIAVGAAADKIVFAGGWYWDMMYSMVPANTVDIYNTTTGIWSKTTLSSKRDNVTAAVVGNKIIFAGGTGNMGDVNKVDVYDAVSGTWVTSLMPEAKSSMRSAVIENNAFFAGGTGGTTGKVYIYNSIANTWSSVNMPTALTGFSMSVINGKLYLAGGTIPGTNTYSNLVQIYDPIANTWANEYLSIARTGVAATSVGNIGYFAGGTVAYGYPTPTNTKRVDIFTAPFRIGAASNISAPLAINVYPNPATRVINVNANDATYPLTVAIFDLTGKEITRTFMNGNYTEVDVSNLLPGTYIMVITDENDGRVVKKFIKQ